MANHVRLFGADIYVSSQSMPDHMIRLFGVDIPVSSENSVVPVYNPAPLRSYPPRDKSNRKRKREDKGHERVPTIPGELLQKIENGEPSFVYQKNLEHSDVLKGQSRLFVNRRERFEEFLEDGEKAIMNDGAGKGLEDVVCVDARRGSGCYKLRLKVWGSMDVLAIKSGWSKLVEQNNAKPGDVVQIWGYREMGNLRLAINFQKPPQTTSSTTNDQNIVSLD